MIGAFPIIGCFNPDVMLCFLRVLYTAGVPSLTAGKGISSGPSDDGTGLFTLTTSFPWRDLIGGGELGFAANASGLDAEVVAINPTSRTVQIRINAVGGGAADPTSLDGLYLMLAFQCGGATSVV